MERQVEKIMKILNLYSGIGGNRKLWGDEHEIVAIENDPKIAEIYQEFFPRDKVIVIDAHQYLLDHFKEFDFIWSSPPCPTHSDIRRCGVHKGQYKAVYPAMELYQEIILLKHFGTSKWVIENVKPYYEPLIAGQVLERHLFWSNFVIREVNIKDDRIHDNIKGTSTIYEFNLDKFKGIEKRNLLRNMVNPELGLFIFQESFREYKTLF